MARTAGGGIMGHDPIASVLSDRDKRVNAARILGQAYVTAHNLMTHNREKIDRIAGELVVRREIYGDDLIELLNRQQLEAPAIDYGDEQTWPRI
jgi:ATP-dependent Zn protease